jgi:hypothetical protein
MSRPRVLGAASHSATRMTDISCDTPVKRGETPTVCRNVRHAGSRPLARADGNPPAARWRP